MVTKAVVEIGGRVEESLPDGVHRVTSELAALRAEQRADIRQSTLLQNTLKNLNKGTGQYANVSKDLAATQARIGDRGQALIEKQQELQEVSGGLTGTIRGLVGRVRALGPAGAIAAAGITTVTVAAGTAVKAMLSLNAEVQQLQSLTARGADSESIQRLSRGLVQATGDMKSAQTAAAGLGTSVQTILNQLARGQAPREQLRAFFQLGITDADLRRFSPTELFEELAKGVRNLDPVRARAWVDALAVPQATKDALLEVAYNVDVADRVIQQFKRRGILDERMITLVDEFSGGWNRIKFATKEAMVALLGVAADPLTKTINKIADAAEATSGWLNENQHLIRYGVDLTVTVAKLVAQWTFLDTIMWSVKNVGGFVVAGFKSVDATVTVVKNSVMQVRDAFEWAWSGINYTMLRVERGVMYVQDAFDLAWTGIRINLLHGRRAVVEVRQAFELSWLSIREQLLLGEQAVVRVRDGFDIAWTSMRIAMLNGAGTAMRVRDGFANAFDGIKADAYAMADSVLSRFETLASAADRITGAAAKVVPGVSGTNLTDALSQTRAALQEDERDTRAGIEDRRARQYNVDEIAALNRHMEDINRGLTDRHVALAGRVAELAQRRDDVRTATADRHAAVDDRRDELTRYMGDIIRGATPRHIDLAERTAGFAQRRDEAAERIGIRHQDTVAAGREIAGAFVQHFQTVDWRKFFLPLGGGFETEKHLADLIRQGPGPRDLTINQEIHGETDARSIAEQVRESTEQILLQSAFGVN